MTQIPFDSDTFEVVCRLGMFANDGDDLNTAPDIVTTSGKVTISVLVDGEPVKTISYLEDDGHHRIIQVRGIEYFIDRKTGKLLTGNNQPVSLYKASSPRVKPNNFTYLAVITFPNNFSLSIQFDETPTHADGSVDLGALTVIPATDGTPPITVMQTLLAMQSTVDETNLRLEQLVLSSGRLIKSGLPPTSVDDTDENNIWLNTLTGELYSWNGQSWVVITDPRLQQSIDISNEASEISKLAKSNADSAVEIAEDAKTGIQDAVTAAAEAKIKADQAAQDLLDLVGLTGRVIRNDVEPVGDDQNVNNLWLNSSTGKLYSWNGSLWMPIDDPDVQQAISTADAAANAAVNAEALAQSAQTLADSAKAKAVEAYNTAAIADSNATGALAEAASAKADVALAQADVLVAKQSAEQAVQDAQEAVGIANDKSSVFIQSTPPDAKYRLEDTLWIDVTQDLNTPKMWNGDDWIAITDKEALDAADLAAQAKTAADQAIEDLLTVDAKADQAVADALGAMNTANTANQVAQTADGRMTVALANPTVLDASGKSIGSVWDVRSGATILRRFVLTADDTWTQVKIGNDFVGENAIGRAQISEASIGTLELADLSVVDAKVGNLTTDKLLAGTSLVRESVVERIIGDAATFGALTANRLLIGSAENIIPNGDVNRGILAPWHSDLVYDSSDKPAGYAASIKCTPGKGNVFGINGLNSWFDVVPNASYHFEIWLKADKPGSVFSLSMSNQLGVGAGFMSADSPDGGSSLGSGEYLVNQITVPTVWTRFSGIYTMKSDTSRARLEIGYFNHPSGTETNAVQSIAGLRLRSQMSSVQIGNGIIKGVHADLDSLAASLISSRKLKSMTND